MITNVLQYLENSAASAPQKIAFSDENRSLSFAELLRRSKAIGTALAKRLSGVRGQPVYIHMTRSANDIAAFLGAAYSGNFYVPFDVDMPPARAASMRRVMPPAVELTLGDTQSLCTTEPDPGLLEEIRAQVIDQDPLYGMFTSGSTGIPKGIVVSHRSVINMAERFTETFDIGSDTIFGNQAPFDFDVSVKDIYLALKNGATVHILPRKAFTLTSELMEILNDRQVNTLVWSVSAMKIVSSLGTFPDYRPRHVRLVMFSGEVLPVKVLNQWRENLPRAGFVNLYGPTEITCNCAYYKIDRDFALDERIPIGRAFKNTEVLLLDGDRLVSEPYKTGELCVRGVSLAHGYYNNPEQTAKAFRQNPLQSAYPELIYHTGDICQYNRRGELEFLGRSDSQVKYMGHRIELGEIEIAALAVPFVQSACCLFDAARERMVLFYQSTRERNGDLVRALKEILPRHMVPSRLQYYEELPVNRTGKIDRAALQTSLSEPLRRGE